MSMGMVRSQRIVVFVAVVASAGFLPASAFADIVKYSNRDAWFSAVGGESVVTTIGFTGFPDATVITDQYESLGVTFIDGNDFVFPLQTGFPQDGWGLAGSFDITIQFARPLTSISVDFPGDIQFNLYESGQSVGVATFFAGGVGNFAGIISTTPFDTLLIVDPTDGVAYIDDLHFVTIPAPGCLFTLSLILLSRSRRRP